MPQSITTTERLTISARMRCGTPAATTRISARRVSRARLRVRRWLIWTVASAASRSAAAGRPTTAERPTTTAPLAGDRDPVGAQDGHHRQRGGRHEGALAAGDLAGVEWRGAVHVLGGVDQLDHARGVQVGRHRLGDHDAGDARDRGSGRRCVPQVGEGTPSAARPRSPRCRRCAPLARGWPRTPPTDRARRSARPPRRGVAPGLRPAPRRGPTARATGAMATSGRRGSSRSRRHDPPVDDGRVAASTSVA